MTMDRTTTGASYGVSAATMIYSFLDSFTHDEWAAIGIMGGLFFGALTWIRGDIAKIVACNRGSSVYIPAVVQTVPRPRRPSQASTRRPQKLMQNRRRRRKRRQAVTRRLPPVAHRQPVHQRHRRRRVIQAHSRRWRRPGRLRKPRAHRVNRGHRDRKAIPDCRDHVGIPARRGRKENRGHRDHREIPARRDHRASPAGMVFSLMLWRPVFTGGSWGIPT